MKRYFLGLAANLGGREIWRHVFAVGTEADRSKLRAFLAKKYDGEAILTKNGRSGLAIALKAFFRPGEAVLVNGFTCYAVYEALVSAGVTPIWVDISPRDLNFTTETLKVALKRCPEGTKVRGLIVQNTLGNPVDMAKIERWAKRHRLLIVEDLAHSVGTKYADGREVGTGGVATAFSFGKDKVVDATSGGAVVIRGKKLALDGIECQSTLEVIRPTGRPRPSDVLRARFYPLFGAIVRGLTGVHLGGVLMRFLIRIHWVEKSADNRLSLTETIPKFEAKLALERLKRLPRRGRRQLRSFYLVRNRAMVLRELRQNGYYFGGFWYEKPVAPERYYEKVDFPEEDCPVATLVAQEIVNLPNYYNARELLPARKIIEASEIRLQLTNRGVIEQVREVAVKNARAGGQKMLWSLATKISKILVDAEEADKQVEEEK